MDKSLEKIVAKSTKARERISNILEKDFEIPAELADVIALQATNQALGSEAVEEYEAFKLKQKQEKASIDRVKNIKAIAAGTGIISGVSLAAFIVVVILYNIVLGIYGCATAPEEFKTAYRPIPEHVRFVDAERSDWDGTSVYGLNDYNNLCLFGESFRATEHAESGSGANCIHRNKVASLNEAMDRAVKEDFNGVLWNEPNGNGKIWVVERNNYRFVIKHITDPNYKK